MTVETKQGFHIYFKYDENILTTVNGLTEYNSVDIRNDDSIIFAPPSSYILNDDSIITYKFLGGELISIPPFFLQLLKQNNQKIIQNISTIKSDNTKKIKSDKFINQQENNSNNETFIKLTIEKGCLKQRIMDYQKWLCVGYAIWNILGEEIGHKYFKQFSTNELKDRSHEYLTSWNCFKDTDKTKFTMNSFKKWVKEDSPELYDEIENSFDINKYIPFDITTDIGTVKFILSFTPEKFMWVNGDMYCWTEFKWEKNIHEFVRFIGSELCDHLDNTILKYKDSISAYDYKKIYEFANTIKNNWKKRSNFMNIMKTTESFMTKNDVKFDAKDDLFGFNNGVYDLTLNTFRPYKYDDYMTMTCGYDYNDSVDTKKTNELLILFQQIIPDSETRELYLQILSCGFTGRCIEKFIIFNGNGRNGKGMINEYLIDIFGDYAYIYSHISLLTEKDNTGGNPEKFKLDKKRIVIFKEPNGDIQLRNDRVNDITGGGNLSGRDIYANSNKCDIKLNNITIMECNNRPVFYSEPQHAEMERLIDIYFPNKFSTKDDIDEPINNINIFRGDSKYKTFEWKIAYRNEMLHILLNAFNRFKNNNYVFKLPECVINRTNEYLDKSFPLLGIFNNYYEISNEENSFISINDIIDYFNSSTYYKTLAKLQQRRYSNEYIMKFFSTHKNFKKCYYERKRIKNKDYRHILVGYKKKESDEN